MDTPHQGSPDHGLEQTIIDALRTIYDPEVPVNLYDMGLIYGVEIADDGAVNIRMTLTTPACPVAGILPQQVQAKVKALPGVSGCEVELVWDPPWTPDRMSEAARLQLNMDVQASPSTAGGQKLHDLRLPRRR